MYIDTVEHPLHTRLDEPYIRPDIVIALSGNPYGGRFEIDKSFCPFYARGRPVQPRGKPCGCENTTFRRRRSAIVDRRHVLQRTWFRLSYSGVRRVSDSHFQHRKNRYDGLFINNGRSQSSGSTINTAKRAVQMRRFHVLFIVEEFFISFRVHCGQVFGAF